MTEKERSKREKEHRKWEKQIEACEKSGLQISEWCRANRINESTYHSRRKRIREEKAKREKERQQEIVRLIEAKEAKQETFETSEAAIPHHTKEKIIIRKENIEIELGQETEEKIVYMLLRGLKQC